ncbi:MAG: dUTP diphosphatase [Abditibacteriota bacterium]|nr:dUTP diphosphatase [Abditibacteriota bacterium]
MRTRGFEKVSKYADKDIKLPKRSTKNAAGYDFFAPEDMEIPSSLGDMFRESFGKLVNEADFIKKFLTDHNFMSSDNGEAKTAKPKLLWTGIKAYMLEDEYLGLYNRSSNPKKLGLILANGVGVVDSDYYNNPDNEGEIGFAFYNIFPWTIKIKKGDKLGQGIFTKFLKADNDDATQEREGGFGSTGE